MDKITNQITGFAAGLKFADLAPATVHAATQRLVDAIGCGIGAHDCEPAKIGRKLAEGQSPGRYAGRTLLFGEQLPAEVAAFINTALIRNFDFNDRYPGGHPSDCLGALLALAGAMPVDGERFLAAMTVAYEIFARLADAATLSRRGWDQGYGVAISTTAGVCNLLRLSRAATGNAIGIAAASNLPLRVTRSGELSSWKNVATAYAVRNGLFGALLAGEGQDGPASAFEGRNGLFENVTGPFELPPFPTEGGSSLVPRVQLKYWPIETNGQPVVWAALDLRGKVKPEQIAAIEVFANKFTWFEIGSEPQKWDPKNRETADHSLPYILARTLVDGPVGVASFSDEKVRDPSLRPLMARIKVTVDDAMEAALPKMMLRVQATTTDGKSHTVEVVNPLGHPDNPMQDEHIGEKFVALAAPVLGAARCKAALDGWWQVARATDMRELIALVDL